MVLRNPPPDIPPTGEPKIPTQVLATTPRRGDAPGGRPRQCRGMTRHPFWIAVLSAAVFVPVACGSGHSTPQVARAAGAAHGAPANSRAGETQLIHTAAQCLRDHGIPNFPDPVLDTRGQPQIDNQLLNSLPASVTQAAEQACRAQIDAAQQAADANRPPATPQELAQATRFAQCMRRHGWPNFPDPDAQGSFSSSTPGALPASKRDPSFQACRSQLGTRGQ